MRDDPGRLRRRRPPWQRVTERTYDETVLVVRACMLATGRDRAVAEALPGFDELLRIVGLDRRWIVVRRSRIPRTGDSCEVTQSAIDARTGGIRREVRAHPCQGDLPLATEGDPLAVTSRCRGMGLRASPAGTRRWR